MAEPVSLRGNPPPPPKPFIESRILFFVIETITLAATREVYKNSRSTTFSLITFVAGTGFAIKPYSVWNDFINFLDSLPDTSTTYIGDSSHSRCRSTRRQPDIIVTHRQQQPTPTQDIVVVHGEQPVITDGRRAVPKSQQQPSRHNPPQTQTYLHTTTTSAAVVTDGRRAQSKKKGNR